jgi:hypothetical protein
VWGGRNLGSITKFDVEFPAGAVQPFTHLDSRLAGSGSNTRVQAQYAPTTQEPPVISVAALGTGLGLVGDDRGTVAQLSVSFPGGGVSGLAFLVEFRIEGAVGDLMRTSATFRLTGI